jgi:hypothetical protein
LAYEVAAAAKPPQTTPLFLGTRDNTRDNTRRKTPARSVSDRPARADRVSRVILEPRASSNEHRIVITSRFRAGFAPFQAIHLSPWRTESETVLGLSWVAVVGVPWGDGWTLLYGTFGGLLTQETKET